MTTIVITQTRLTDESSILETGNGAGLNQILYMVHVYASEDGTIEEIVASGSSAMECLDDLIDKINRNAIDLNILSLRVVSED